MLRRFSSTSLFVCASCIFFPSLGFSTEIIRSQGHEGPSTVVPTLEYLLSKTLSTHPSVAAGHSGVRSAEQRVKSAKWQYYPTPAVSYQRAITDETDLSYSGDSYATVLSLEQPIWTGGRLSAGTADARARLDESKASLADSKRQLALRLVEAYGDWLLARLQRQSLNESEERHQALFSRVERRAKSGVSTGSDLDLALGRLQTLRALRVATTAREDRALAVLSELVGFPLRSDTLDLGRSAVPRLPEGTESDLVDIGVQLAPAVQRAKAGINAARAEIKGRRSQTRPDLFVRFERQFNNLQFAGRGPESRVLIGVRSQLGAGLSSFSSVAEARESLASAMELRDVEELRVREQIRSDLALFESFRSRLHALRIATQTAQDVYKSYQRQFLTGRKSWLDVMNSARDLEQAQLQHAEATAGQLTIAWRLRVQLRNLSA